MRAVLDVNVIVSALLSRTGTPAHLLSVWTQGAFELVASQKLLDELIRVLRYPKLRDRIPPDQAGELLDWIRSSATLVDDPTGEPPVRSTDPGDDYLIALAAGAQAILVTGDEHLLGIETAVPILSPAAFRTILEQRSKE